MKSPRPQLFGIALLVTALDQLTKQLVVRSIPLYDEKVIIPRFFSISHVMNTGAAFSLFAHSAGAATTALAAFSAIVMALICFLLWRTRAWSVSAVSLALILGGATGNFIDRVRLKAVVDFLSFDFGSYHYPDFNLADSAIVVGAILLAADALFGKHSSEPEHSRGRAADAPPSGN
jgi:signal peptidase II